MNNLSTVKSSDSKHDIIINDVTYTSDGFYIIKTSDIHPNNRNFGYKWYLHVNKHKGKKVKIDYTESLKKLDTFISRGLCKIDLKDHLNSEDLDYIRECEMMKKISDTYFDILNNYTTD